MRLSWTPNQHPTERVRSIKDLSVYKRPVQLTRASVFLFVVVVAEMRGELIVHGKLVQEEHGLVGRIENTAWC